MEASTAKQTESNDGTKIEFKTEGEASGVTPTVNINSSPSNSPLAKIRRSKIRPKPTSEFCIKKVKEELSSNSDDSYNSTGSSTSDSLSSGESSEASDVETKRDRRDLKRNSKAKQKIKMKKSSYESSSDSSSETSSNSSAEKRNESTEQLFDLETIENYQKRLINLEKKTRKRHRHQAETQDGNWNLDDDKNLPPISVAQVAALLFELRSLKKTEKVKKSKKNCASKLEFKRVDELWDNNIHNYRLSDTAEDGDGSEYDQYLFTVRRTFDWEGKYKSTTVDIKSKPLKQILSQVMNGIKGISLVEDTPSISPNLLFLYLEDLRQAYKELKKSKSKCKKKKKKRVTKSYETKRKHLKILLKYLDKDYSSTKKTLYPMLESGIITYDFLWALYKPNTLAFTSTYGCADEPRVFKVEIAEKESSMLKGDWYNIEGKYLEYDGKIWGMGNMECDVPSFKGARKIMSLNCYPLKYHHNEEKIRSDLIERGKKFVLLQGVNYKCHEGMAFYKKRKQVVKVHINGRIMIDPATHRRILPNYNVSTVKLKDSRLFEPDAEATSEKSSESEDETDDETKGYDLEEINNPNTENEAKTKLKLVRRENKDTHEFIEVPVDDDGHEIVVEKLDKVQSELTKSDDGVDSSEKKELPLFTDEEYLIASPVVLGFAFAEKLWLEFTVRGIKEITWNDGAYDSLVLEENTKAIVKALVNSYKYHPTKNIDDVIQGKGRGLVAVLHGPPGTGKTLTAEGISELLKCPLYMVSAGELGTDPRTLESELQKILDIAHAWGAVLLLDEADVFLEKRTSQDIHRNALVSIFLRHLEYFQGILFLTTNRVETFDDAFQSRIHIAIRYGELNIKARRVVFEIFLKRAYAVQKTEMLPFTEEDLNTLSKHCLNGRQIKNTIRTAQALAIQYNEALNMHHIKTVLEMSNSFDRDLKGGPGYEEAMRGYF